MNSKEKILTRLRAGLSQTAVPDSSNMKLPEQLTRDVRAARPAGRRELIDLFRSELEKVNGKCHGPLKEQQLAPSIAAILKEAGCTSLAFSGEEDLRSIAGNLKRDFNMTPVTATGWAGADRKEKLSGLPAALFCAHRAVAELGQVVVFYDHSKTSLPHFLCDLSIILLKTDDIVADPFALFESISTEQAKNMVFITGPSRTADIEKVLLLGAHGPRRVEVILTEEES